MATAAKKPVVQATICPVGRKEFNQTAPAMLEGTVAGKPVTLERKNFKGSGSLGYFSQGKTVIKVGEKECIAQVQVQIILVGSKELPGEPGYPDAEGKESK